LELDELDTFFSFNYEDIIYYFITCAPNSSDIFRNNINDHRNFNCIAMVVNAFLTTTRAKSM
jgi:hypothetical protein